MHVFKHSVAIVVSTLLSGVAVTAATLSSSNGPAENPPASYTSKQYVDSNGCVYVRAGVGNSVTWVPRVTRSRQLVCGYQPTLQGKSRTATTQTTVAPKTVKKVPSPAPAPTVLSNSSTTKTVVKAPATKTKTAKKKPSPGPAPLVFVNPQGSQAEATQVAQAQPKKKKTRQTPSPAPAPTVLSTTAPVATQPVQKTRVVKYVAPVNTQSTAPKTTTTAQAVLVPPVPRLPAGYKPVWDDDRLNPKRGYRTERGEATMRMVWTDTVPRRLVPESGQDVKLIEAHLRYEAANGTGTKSRSATGTKTAPKAVRVAKATPSRTVVTKSGGRFVQVGAFGVMGNAQATAVKFQKMGLPVVLRNTKRNGKKLSVLFLGPFARNTDIKTGLNAAHSAGFKDAFVK